MTASRGRTSAVLAAISAGSKLISLGRDAAFIAVLGLGRAADRLQISIAIASGIAGVLGTSGGLALAGHLSTHRSAISRLHGPFRLVHLVIAVCGIAVSVGGWNSPGSSFALLLPICGVVGLLDALSSTILLSLNAVTDTRAPAAVLGAQGFVATSGVIGLAATGQASPFRLAAVLALDSALVSFGLSTRMTRIGRQTTGQDDDPIFTSRLLTVWGATASTYAMSTVSSVAERVIAARVPGGAALFALAQRAALVPSGLVVQPFLTLALPAMATPQTTVTAAQALVRFQASFGRLVVLAATVAALASPWVAEFTTHESIRTLGTLGVRTVVLLLVAVPFTNLSAVALRDWLVARQPLRMVLTFACSSLVSVAGLAVPIKGAIAAAGLSLVAQVVQAGASTFLSTFLRQVHRAAAQIVRGPMRLTLELLLSVGLIGSIIWNVGRPVLLIILAIWIAVVFASRPRRVRDLLSHVFPHEFGPAERNDP